MALAQVERIEIIASNSIKDDLLIELQEAGLVEIEEVSSKLSLNPGKKPAISFEPLLFRLRQAINYLSLWRKNRLGERWFKAKPLLSRQERQALLNQDWTGLIERIEKLEASCREIKTEIKALEKEKEILEPWRKLDFPLPFLKGTESWGIFLVRLPRSHLASLIEFEKEQPLWLYMINLDKKNAYLLILFWRKASKEIEDKLKEEKASFFFVPETILKKAQAKETIEEIISHLETEIEEKKKILLAIEKESQEVSSLLPQLMIVLDVFENEQQRIQAYGHLAETEKTVFLQGWIEKDKLPGLKKKLTLFEDNLALFHRPPTEEEEPPVVLRNPPLIEPFQVVTNLYGLPRPRTIDPTLALAPFFFIYVGLCVSEAGYGLLVAWLSWLFMIKAKPRGSTLLFSRLMLALGISTVVCGTLVGGWFGYPIRQLLLIDPLTQPVSFLLLALTLGFIQVWFGTFLKIVDNWRRNKNLAQALAQIGWLILLPSLVLYGWKKIELLGYFALGGASLIVLFSSRKKNPLLRLLSGLYSLYDISKYLGDILSYSRLLALGLSTSVIAMVVNTLVGTALKIPIVGWLAAPIIFLGGHLFNLAISFLGGFVHSMRLQFVEFFTKFYEAGGRPLKPFSLQGKYVEFQ
ncbi:MAG: V-type ATP synthase subunit I [Candidatus Aminicenantes bacterium]|nr:V-type ATP synthase subunit I [Candidatus Aminicenantes bacterium]